MAGARRVLDAVLSRPGCLAHVAALAEGEDGLLSMRAMDVLEKLAHLEVQRVQPYKRLFIGPLADSTRWEIRLQIVRALPLLRWTARERRRVTNILFRDVGHAQKFVRAWALDSLATLAREQPALRPFVLSQLASFENSGSKALAARARSIRKRATPFHRPRKPSRG